jgi:toxin-antitoxin system PIN domain toxin
VGFDWMSLVGFVRLVTMRRLFDDPLSSEDAMRLVREWLDRSSSVVVTPTARHLDVMEDLLRHAGRAGNLTNDAHLAALAVEHRAEIVTLDSDFARFPGVRWHRPTLGGAL